MRKEKKWVYVIKYLFTKGIQKRQVWKREAFFYDVKNTWLVYSLAECFDTLEEAKEAAQKKSVKKIAALEKQIEKVRAMDLS